MTVVGGTGFLGRRIVARLVEDGRRLRIAVRNPDRAQGLFPTEASRWVESVRTDVRDEDMVASALAGSRAVVNAVSAYVEKKGVTYRDVHERGAQNVAACAERLGVEALVHVSGIGADAASRSRYVRSRGRGEQLVRGAFGEATIVRPSAMFGPDDAFVNSLAAVGRATPVLPVFAGGTLVQPVSVDDVAEAIRRILDTDCVAGRTFELGGPKVYTFRTLVDLAASRGGRKPRVLPIPTGFARLAAWCLERLPEPPLTRGQVELLAHDNVVSRSAPGFGQLGIAPKALETFLYPNAAAVEHQNR